MTATAASADELELQHQVTRVLESQGVLDKIKAQLRAAVFQAIHSAGTSDGGRDPLSTRASSQSTVVPAMTLLQSFGTDAHVALELVHNFLECLDLDHTLTVFLAESGLDAAGEQASEWRVPSRLCERVCVPVEDETTPVLIKLLRTSTRDVAARATMGGGGHYPQREAEPRVAEPVPVAISITSERGRFDSQEESTKAKPPLTSPVELPPLTPAPVQPAPTATPTQATQPNKSLDDGDDDGELEASLAEEVASGSFEEKSIAESAASANQSQSEDFAATKPVEKRRSVPPGRFGIQRDEDEDGEDEEEISPSIASPPPVPAKLGPLPSLPGITRSREEREPVGGDGSDEEQEANDLRGHEPHADEHDNAGDDDELDENAAAARLRSLEEKLKEMEAEDDTGVLQQLKSTALDDAEEPEPVAAPPPSSRPVAAEKATTDDNEGGDDEDDNYGSDFEEEVDEEEIASEMSEDIASMSVLSESEDASVAATIKTAPTPNALANDTPVDSEDALNSYDYIEAVERD